ncbi:T-cell surface antigen CD2-like [Scyliorhinus canicula]|uniref:T-cell surface antigen CD2-like n=1 Tax=Scyliorhinus canicula TaxID=7830 RepID=UPI0018F6B8E6|nr:T-cell surface antigen CD2-like [Scyliorhinus canicula]
MISYSNCAQYSLILMIAVSGRFLTEGTGDVGNVYSECGHPLFVHFWNQSFNTESDFKWVKESSTLVARYKNGSRAYGKFKSRVEIFPNGTLRFDITTKDDEGEYRFEAHNKDGKLQFSQDFKLHLLEKLSTPVLDITCDSEQGVTMSCRVQGGTPDTFYLNDQQLTEDNAVFSSDGKKATLKNSNSFFGNKTFFCKVENRISKSQTDPRELTCADSTEGHDYVKTLIIILAVVIGLIILWVWLIIFARRNLDNNCKIRSCE